MTLLTHILTKLLQAENKAQHHVDSYNLFIKDDILEFFKKKVLDIAEIKENDVDTTKYFFKVGKVELNVARLSEVAGISKKLTPTLATLKNLTYSADLMLELTLFKQINEKEPIAITKKQVVKIGNIPIMIGSMLDPEPVEKWDLSGYMIVKGSEKVVMGLEEIGRNILLNDHDADTDEYTVHVYSSKKGYRFLNTLKFNKQLVITFQPVNVEVPVLDLLKVLGLTDKDIIKTANLEGLANLELISYLQTSNSLEQSIDTLKDIFSPNQTAQYSQERLNYIIDNYLLLHVGSTEETRKQKALYLLNMLTNWFKLKHKQVDPIFVDSYEYKRIKVVGDLMKEIFLVYFEKMMSTVKDNILKSAHKKNIKLASIINSDIITNGINNALSSGTWIGNKQDLVTVLDRTNYFAALYTLKKVKSPLVKTQQHLKARIIDPTHRCRIDVADTPHNISIGLVKNLAMAVRISSKFDENAVISSIKANLPKGTKYAVQHEGHTFMYTDNLDETYSTLCNIRAKGIIPIDCNFRPLKDHVNIITDTGRVLRPLIVNKNFKEKNIENMDLQTLIKKNVIEYVDVFEESYLTIAEHVDKSEGCTHSEISEILLFGIASGIIPFFNKLGGSRSGLAQKLSRQAITKYIPMSSLRPYTRNIYLHEIQKPLVRTRVQEITQEWLHDKQLGYNVLAAITTFRGYNLEDGYVAKKEAIERGLFAAIVKKTMVVESSNTGDITQNKFTKPTEMISESHKDLLQQDGLPAVYTTISEGDVIVGKTGLQYAAKLTLDVGYVDRSVIFKDKNKSRIDNLTIMKNSDDTFTCNLLLTYDAPLIKGDKIVSRYAQKGIISKVISERFLPFSQHGHIPDILANPHSYPSRLIFGHTQEKLFSKAAALLGEPLVVDFDTRNYDINFIEKILVENGYRADGKEIFYDPIDGIQLQNPISIGMSYFYRLLHMVSEKSHTRAKGAMQILTNQPTEGRQKGGGLRMGEMERDALIAHGVSAVVKERFSIDTVTIATCELCACAVSIKYNEVTQCHNCASSAYIRYVDIPYAFKLLLEELESLNIKIGLHT